MTNKQPFARRIVIAFVLMTFVVSGFFSIGVIAVVHIIEEQIISNTFGIDLDNILKQGIQNGNPPYLGRNTKLYSSDSPTNPIPPGFADLPDGFTEVLNGKGDYYAYSRKINGQHLLILQDQQEFESRERLIFTTVWVCFLISLLGAWLMGLMVAKRIMRPVSRLAKQVQHRDQLLSLAPPLAPDYANDEVGRLASAFDSTLAKLRNFLTRERLFTSDVSHELRTPLMIITSSCELLKESELTRRQKDQIARIASAAYDMSNLVQTFLLLARDKKSNSILGDSTSLKRMAEKQEDLWAPMILEKGLTFARIEESPDAGRYNSIFLQTVMSNLLRNALHYTEQGKVTLILEKSGFRVEDTGIGIAIEQQEKIFQPFNRGTQALGEGMGLGLSLVKRICDHEGWDISISNLTPRGSCFSIKLNKQV